MTEITSAVATPQEAPQTGPKTKGKGKKSGEAEFQGALAQVGAALQQQQQTAAQQPKLPGGETPVAPPTSAPAGTSARIDHVMAPAAAQPLTEKLAASPAAAAGPGLKPWNS